MLAGCSEDRLFGGFRLRFGHGISPRRSPLFPRGNSVDLLGEIVTSGGWGGYGGVPGVSLGGRGSRGPNRSQLVEQVCKTTSKFMRVDAFWLPADIFPFTWVPGRVPTIACAMFDQDFVSPGA